MDKSYYEKAIRKALKDNRTYDKGHEFLIKKTAQYCAVIDTCFDDIESNGPVIRMVTRESNISYKQNPAAAIMEKYGKIVTSMFSDLGLSPKASLGVSEEDPVNKLLKKVNSISA